MDTETFLLYTETLIISRVIFGVMEDFTAVLLPTNLFGVSSLSGIKWSFQLFGSVDANI